MTPWRRSSIRARAQPHLTARSVDSPSLYFLSLSFFVQAVRQARQQQRAAASSGADAADEEGKEGAVRHKAALERKKARVMKKRAKRRAAHLVKLRARLNAEVGAGQTRQHPTHTHAQRLSRSFGALRSPR